MLYKVLRVIVLACLLNGLVLSTAFAQNHNLYHFDDPVPIELNLNRIAVFAETQDTIAVESLADLGIAVTTVEAFPIPGWQLIRLPIVVNMHPRSCLKD